MTVITGMNKDISIVDIHILNSIEWYIRAHRSKRTIFQTKINYFVHLSIRRDASCGISYNTSKGYSFVDSFFHNQNGFEIIGILPVGKFKFILTSRKRSLHVSKYNSASSGRTIKNHLKII